MTASSEGNDSRLAELLLCWEELHRQGRSLAAAELCSTCPELTEELARRIALLRRMGLVPADSQTAPGDPSPAQPVGGSNRQAATARAEFRDLRFHAAGALGEVFMARNAELNREVALKFLKPERAGDPDSLRRFLQEAEITGRLEHPGVVPIYALGADGSGSPCYAMRFIRGATFQDAIDAFHAAELAGRDPTERSLALRELLNRFVSVCSTVAYAHSRGILHRDLKPRNVMLGKYDETLVMDWGLAKPFDRDESARSIGEETLMPSSGSGSDSPTVGAVGTPAYMSPEQAQGRWDLVGPASDISGLGAILYTILTGRAPYQGRTIGEVLERVKRCEFRAPRQVQPGVPRAREAICLKAMAAQPEHRYATPLELAADVRRWLADEPVLADREPLPTRAGRWVRRHKLLLAAGAVLLISTVVGLVINNRMVRQERDLARRARDAALIAEVKAERARTEAEQARQKEAKARSDAVTSSALAREAVDQMLIKVAEERLPHAPGMVRLRKEIAQEALQIYRRFRRQRPDDRAVRRDTAMILRRVANIERMTNDFRAALGHYAESEALYEKLAAEFPQVPRYRDLLAELELDFAAALTMASQPKNALTHYDKAHDIARKQHAAQPGDPNYQRTLARIQNDFGLALFEAGRTREGLDRCNQAVELFTGLSRRQPLQHPLDPLLRLMALVDRAPLQRDAGAVGEAQQALAEAVTLARTLLRQSPEDADVRYYLAAARCEQGTIFAEEHKDAAEAERAFDESVRELSALRAQDPEIGFYRPKHAEAQAGRGGARAEAGRLDAAEDDCRTAQQTLEAILAESPQDWKAASLLAATQARRARIAQSGGDRAGAAQLWDQAIARQEAVIKALPDNPRARGLLQRLHDERKHVGRPS